MKSYLKTFATCFLVLFMVMLAYRAVAQQQTPNVQTSVPVYRYLDELRAAKEAALGDLAEIEEKREELEEDAALVVEARAEVEAQRQNFIEGVIVALREFGGVDFALLGGGIWLFAAALKRFVQFLKLRVERRWNAAPHWIPHAINFPLGLLLAWLIHESGNLSAPELMGVEAPYNWIAFGLAASMWAAGSKDLDREQPPVMVETPSGSDVKIEVTRSDESSPSPLR